MRNWYRMEASQTDARTIHLYDEIGKSFWSDDTVTAAALVAELAALPAAVRTLNVHINSPGGDVFEGLAITNALRDQRTVHGRTVNVWIDGLAGSIASVIAMAGETIWIADNAMVFVHRPWTITAGDADDHRQQADLLDKIGHTIVATYRWHSELSEERIRELMKAETWMSADEAIANGFATEKVEGLETVALLDAGILARLKVPDTYRQRVAALTRPAPAAASSAAAALDVVAQCRAAGCGFEVLAELLETGATPEVVAARIAEDRRRRAPMDPGIIIDSCEAAGLDLTFARALMASAQGADDVEARIAAEKRSRIAAGERSKLIRLLCERGRVPYLTDLLTESGITADGCRMLIGQLGAMQDISLGEIDNHLNPDVTCGRSGSARRPSSPLAPAEIYARRNQPTGRN